VNRLSAASPYVFLVLALATSLFMTVNLPPYMGVDEPAHVARADLITLGRLVGQRVPAGGQLFAGGPADLSIYDAEAPFADLIGDPTRKADVADFAAAAGARWDGRVRLSWYAGSAPYPPLFYLPASAGFALGKLLGQPVVQSLYLARMGNALACALIGFAALVMAGRARPFFFSILMLPMSQFLFATVTADGCVVAVAALGCAVIAGALSEGRPLKGRELLAVSACFGLVGMTKPPYALMGLVLLAAPTAGPPRRRLAAAAAPLAVALAWAALMAWAVQTPVAAATDPGGQVHFLLTHPAAMFPIAGHTLARYAGFYARGFIGILGWLDVHLPGPYHLAAWAALALALALGVSQGRPEGWRRLPLAAVAVGVAVVGAVFAALYITWDPVGMTYVEGVQGRYFLPVAFLAPLVFLGGRPLADRLPERWKTLAVGAVLAFPLISALILERAIIVRYYLD
jgi:hypothetical protein